jgi:hypothetical protein
VRDYFDLIQQQDYSTRFDKIAIPPDKDIAIVASLSPLSIL